MRRRVSGYLIKRPMTSWVPHMELIMSKRITLLGLLATLILGSTLSPVKAGWWHGRGWYGGGWGGWRGGYYGPSYYSRYSYYPRNYGGFYRAPYYSGYYASYGRYGGGYGGSYDCWW
jgi:hypothetical protein